MTIILFLIDTSASMCQKVHVNGVQKTYLDVAKGAVETFLKFRQRSQDCMGDRYMLLTFEDPPANVKAGWKENHATFMNELKNLQSNGLTCMGEALKNAFDLLNLNRMQSGIDTYGQGRCPFYLETSVIIVITDGGKYSFRNGVHNEIVLPLHAQIPGTKLTKEPFRWDQRLFSLVLRMAGHRVDERIDIKVPHDESPIEKMCEVTGGRSYKIRSHHVLNHCIETLVQKVQPGVVVQFDQLVVPKEPPKDGEIPEPVFPTTKKMIYVQKNVSNKNYPVGYWPIPEPYWPDPKAAQLPPRDAHPRIRIVTPCVDEVPLVRNFPIDKYELEASPLTMQILARREVNRCWPVLVANSGIPLGHDLPFGYLKANATLTQVYLMVLPISYSVLLPLLNDLFNRYMGNPPSEWMYRFTHYVRSIPQYYCPFLRRALAAANVPYQLLSYIIPENLDSYLSQPVANHLKQLKNTAKQDLEALCMKIFKQMKHPRPLHKQVETAKLLPLVAANAGVVTGGPTATVQSIGGAGQRRDLVSHPMLKDTFAKIHGECQLFDNYTIVVPIATIRGQLTGSAPVTHTAIGICAAGPGTAGGVVGNVVRSSRNPFDIRRRDLVDEIARMRENFFKMVGPAGGLAGNGPVAAGHCLPISEMGNYQEYLKNKETPLREIEPSNVRQHMFGNPYKKDKHMVMVDEADMVGDVQPSPMMKNNNSGVALGQGGGAAGPLVNKKLDPLLSPAGPGLPKGLSRKRKAGPIARDFKFRRLSTSSLESGSSPSEVDYGSESASSVCSDLDDERLVMDFDESPVEVNITGRAAVQEELEVHAQSENRDAMNGQSRMEGDRIGVGGLIGLGGLHVAPTGILTPSEGVLSPMFQQPQLIVGNPGLSPIATPIVPTGVPLGTPVSLAPTTVVSSSNAFQSDARKHNGVVGSGALAERSLSAQSASDYNDAHEISKILQQSCSPHNGAISGEADRKAARNEVAPQSMEEETSPVTNVAGGGGRKRRQMTRQSSAEVLDVADALEKDGGDSGHGQATNRRQSTRMGGGSVGGPKNNNTSAPNNLGNTNQHTSLLQDRLSAGGSQVGETLKEESNDGLSCNHLEAKSGRAYAPATTTKVKEEWSPVSFWRNDGDDSPEVIREANYAARTVLFHDIRRPGRDYGLLLQHLELVRGDFETRFAFIQMCIAEALRFHRKKMATTIQEWWDVKIDRITKGLEVGGVDSGAEASLIESNGKVKEAKGRGGAGSRAKANVKLRSGSVVASALTANKC